MGTRIIGIIFGLASLFNLLHAQNTAPFLQEVLVLNGGLYGDPTQDVVLTSYDPYTNTYRASDTIHTQSIQDLKVVGNYAYLAVQDSVVKIDLTTMSRVATAHFPGPSTYRLYVYDTLLMVGNWYGAGSGNLHFYNANDLSYIGSVAQTSTGVGGIAVVGDSIYVSQNLTSSSYMDSAGYIAVIDLATLSFQYNIPGDGVSDMGQLYAYKGKLLALNSGADNYAFYDPATGTLAISPFGADLAGGYSSLSQIVEDTLLTVWNGSIGVFDLNTRTILANALITDTLITGFKYDPLTQQFYVSSTDYFSYTTGLVYDHSGTLTGAFNVGYSPEALALYYGTNHAPVAVADLDTTNTDVDAMVMVLDNDTDADGDSLILSIETAPLNGTATIMASHVHYSPDAGFAGLDSVEYKITDNSRAPLSSTAWAKILVLPGVGIGDVAPVMVSVYPNPTTDLVQVDLGSLENVNLSLVNLNGRVLESYAGQSGLLSFNVAGYPAGIYIVQLHAEGVSQQFRIVKQ